MATNDDGCAAVARRSRHDLVEGRVIGLEVLDHVFVHSEQCGVAHHHVGAQGSAGTHGIELLAGCLDVQLGRCSDVAACHGVEDGVAEVERWAFHGDRTACGSLDLGERIGPLLVVGDTGLVGSIEEAHVACDPQEACVLV